IVMDDPSGVITTQYSLNDGITGIVGTLGDYANLIQFTPVMDPGPATSSDNVVIPELRTLASLIPADQAKLIKVLDVTIDATLVNFPATATNINATDPTATLTLRTFPNAEYSDTPIPASAVNLICLVGQYNDGMQISPRFLADFSDPATDIEAPVFSHPSGSYNEPFDLIITCATPGAEIRYTLDGSEPDLDSTLYSSPITISETTTVKAIAYLGSYASQVNTAEYVFPTSVDDPGAPALQTALLGNYPNPFNPSTSIVFSLKEAGPVRIDIFNLKGQLVRVLLDGSLPAGTQTLHWDGRDNAGNEAGSGIYSYRLTSGSYSNTKKMLMLK
ncbi:MAG: chitobiase/beta-hexosaminidase C-terminal domain-containing protein, partial [Candidatus Syntrophosphaera sp.]|nr:chitobiase/beta-hexosaminidase C-terminal domain-containing protein [Candidatus Syntrophosphaera sp.]